MDFSEFEDDNESDLDLNPNYSNDNTEHNDIEYNTILPNDDMSTDLNQQLQNFQHLQSNLNSFYKKFDSSIDFIYKAVPLTFFIDIKLYEIFEHSQKVIAPKSLLLQLSEYENLELPIYLKINGSDIIFGIIEYVEYIDHLYIPTSKFFDLDLIENEETVITVLKDIPPKAELIKIKPLNEEFYEIQNVKTYLEVWLKKMYITLTSGTVISLPYRNMSISFYIDGLNPADTVSIYEIEEVEIDILPMDEYANKKEAIVSSLVSETETSQSEESNVIQPTTPEFKSFSGQGFKLGSE